jgi:uncharacterized membrane protein
MAVRRRGYVRWTPAAIPLGAVIMALGAWGFFVPLVGPYFNFDFFAADAWSFSMRHWELLLGPGLVAFASGLLMTFPSWGLGQLGTTLAIVAGVWFLVGPSLYPLWTSGQVELGVNHSEGWAALHWIGYFYGLGAAILYLAAFVQGMLSRRAVVEEAAVAEQPGTRERIVTHTS